jgi:hypothetical protein
MLAWGPGGVGGTRPMVFKRPFLRTTACVRPFQQVKPRIVQKQSRGMLSRRRQRPGRSHPAARASASSGRKSTCAARKHGGPQQLLMHTHGAGTPCTA